MEVQAGSDVYKKIRLGDIVVDRNGNPVINGDAKAAVVLNRKIAELLKDGSIRIRGETYLEEKIELCLSSDEWDAMKEQLI